MIIKKKVVPEGVEGPYNMDMLEDTYDYSQYLDKKGTTELVSQIKNLLHNSLSNLLQVDHIYSSAISSEGNTSYALAAGYKFTDYDFIISEVTFYSNDQHNFMPIPKSSVSACISSPSNEFFLQGASTGGTDRRVGFTIASDTTFKVTMLNGTSGYMPKFQGFYGVKFNIGSEV